MSVRKGGAVRWKGLILTAMLWSEKTSANKSVPLRACILAQGPESRLALPAIQTDHQNVGDRYGSLCLHCLV